MVSTDTPRVYVACLAAYNNGKLHGQWVDATDADEIREAIAEVLRTSPEPGAEEWAIHDYEGFGDYRVSEYEDIAKLAEIGALIEQHGEPFLAYLSACEDGEEGEFEGRYCGKYEDEEAYAYEFVMECGWGGLPSVIELGYAGGFGQSRSINIFDSMSPYIKWEAIASELFRHGSCVLANGYVFDMERA